MPIISKNNYLTLGINIPCWAQCCKSYDEICALLGFYAPSDASLLPTFPKNYRSHLPGPSNSKRISLF
jgi:hypothetical protein